MTRWSRRFAAIVLMAALGWSIAVAQTAQTEQLMRQKLAESMQLMGALVVSDWAALERHGRAIQTLARSPAWLVLKSPEYLEHSEEFLSATGNLISAAGKRDQEGALRAYNDLVASCVGCHRYVARSRIVGGGRP
jgi:hypothetical protein